MLKLKRAVDGVLEWALILLMGLSVVNVLWQVFTRFVLGNASSFTEELARYLLIWIGMLGAAYCVGRRLHLAIDLLPMKLVGRAKQQLDVFIQACVLLFGLVVMIFGGSLLVNLTLVLEQTSASLEVGLGYVYLVVPITGALIVFYALTNALESLRTPGGAASPAPGGTGPAALD